MRTLRRGLILLVLAAVALLVLYVFALDRRLDARLAGGPSRAWSRFFTDRLRVVPGMDLEKSGLLSRLERLDYRLDATLKEPGTWRRRAGAVDIHLRAFRDPEGALPARIARLRVAERRVRSITDLRGGVERRQATLEPLQLDVTWNGSWEARRPVRLADLPLHVSRAVLAAEDERFYHHPGIDLIGVLRAIFVNLRAGEIRQGGSTLTQQLAKNFFLTPERTWSRKAREAVLAWMIESRLTKDEILEWYLNEVYLGRDGAANVIGIGQAARTFFAKRPGELTPGEAAAIAGVIRAPNRNSPLRYAERARRRRDTVLDQMARAGFLSREAAEKGRRARLGVRRASRPALEAPYFLEQVRLAVERRLGSGAISQQRLDIYTTLDPAMQHSAERGVRRTLARLEKAHPWLRRGAAPLEAAFVVLDPGDGSVRALVGGRDFARRPYDHAVQARRQSGSTFKPFVYLAAFESQWRTLTPSSRLEDAPLSLRSGSRIWEPVNYDGRFRGTVTVRTALEKSLNVPTVRLSRMAGVENIAQVAASAGWEGALPRVPALALGVAETSLIDLAGAYTLFPLLGAAAEPFLLRGVMNPRHEIRLRPERETRQAADPRAVYLVHHILEGVIDRGTARSLRAQGFTRAIAGKTGTTSDFRDAWFVGYTPALVGAAWIGFDDGRPLRLPSSATALKLWASAMGPIFDGRPARVFTVPRGIVFRQVDPASGLLPAPACPESIREAFLEGTEPHVDCERRTRLIASRGPIPEPLRIPGRKIGGFFRRILDIFSGGDRNAPPERPPEAAPAPPARGDRPPAREGTSGGELERLRETWEAGRTERER
jgi:penicillin-binding protein 1B